MGRELGGIEVFQQGAEGLTEESVVRDPVLLAAGRVPAMLRELVRVEVFEEGAEGLAEEAVVGDPVFLTADRVVVLAGRW